MLGYDVDVAPVPTEQEIRNSLAKLGYRGFYHTSPSASPSNLRWRLFLPLSRPVAAEEYRALHKHIGSLLGFPVGAQATDPSRAWFVPSKKAGEIFVYGDVDGMAIDAEQKIQLSLPLAVTQESDVINLDPTEEKHEALIDHLFECWPEVGRRDECHMALAGTLARLGYGAEYVSKVVSDLSDATGSDKGPERSAMVRRTYSKLKEGTPVASWGKLVEIIGLENAQKIHEILALRLPRLPSKPANVGDLRDRDDGHVYTYQIGDAPSCNLRSVTMSDLVTNLVTHPDWQGVLRWNTMADTITAVNPPMRMDAENEKFSDEDITLVRMWFEAHEIKAPFDAVKQAIPTAAKSIRWNPVEVYLKNCKARQGAIHELAEKAMGIKDPLSQQMIRKQLIAAVRRALAPNGVKVDSVLIFKGKQDLKKTQFIETLFGAKYVKTNLSDIKSKDAMQELKGIWAVEFGELASVTNADVEALKEFLSRSIDKYRPSFGRVKMDIPRTCVFFATTNDETFLRDVTGNRRFWIVVVEQDIDLKWVRENRDAIWGEAYEAATAEGDVYVSGWGPAKEEHWLYDDLAKQAEDRTKDFLVVDAWMDLIHDYCVGKTSVRTEEIYRMAICGGDPNAPKTLDIKVQMRIGKVLTTLGAKSKTMRVNGKLMRAWALPPAFQEGVRITAKEAAKEPVEQLSFLKQLVEKSNEKRASV